MPHRRFARSIDPLSISAFVNLKIYKLFKINVLKLNSIHSLKNDTYEKEISTQNDTPQYFVGFYNY